MRRQDLAPAATGCAALAVLLTVVTWRPTPDRSDTVILLYTIAAVLEAVALVLTIVDLRRRAAQARRWARSATTERGTSSDQLGALAPTVLEIVSGARLALAATFLFVSLVIGTVANVLSATR